MSAINFSELDDLIERLDAAFSDLDGTLVDNEGSALDAIADEINRYIKEQYGNTHEQVGNIRYLAGVPLPEIFLIIEKQLGLSEPIPNAVAEAISKRRQNDALPGTKCAVIEPIADALAYIKGKNLPIRVVTSSERDRAERFVNVASLNNLVRLPDEIISGKTDFSPPRPKPAPDAYLRGIEECLADPSRTITFEDTVHGGLASIAAGIPTIGVLLGNHIDDEHREQRKSEMLAAGFAGVITSEDDVIPVLQGVLSKMQPPAGPKATQEIKSEVLKT